MAGPILYACVVLFLVFLYVYVRALRRRAEAEEVSGEVSVSQSRTHPTIPEDEEVVLTSSTSDQNGVRRPSRTAARADPSNNSIARYGRRFLRSFALGGGSAAAAESHSSGGSNDSPSGSPSRRPPASVAGSTGARRRHSGPIQFARSLSFMQYLGKRKKRKYSASSRTLPPSDFFEAVAFPEIPSHITPEIFYLHQHLRVLEPPSQWKLNPDDVEVVVVQAGDYLIRAGDRDNSVYVVLEGTLAVIITDTDTKKEFDVKHIKGGDSLLSLLSILDMIVGEQITFRTVTAKAIERCTVARYCVQPICDAFKEDPGAWVQSIQIIVTRLLHVTMTTLHHYLGLSFELTKPSLVELTHPAVSQQKLEERSRHLSGQQSVPKVRRRRLSGSEETATDAIKLARRWFADALGLTADMHLLEERIRIEQYPENHVIVEQGSKEMDSLFLVLNGCLILAQKPQPIFDSDETSDEGEEVVDAVVFGKELYGGLQVLSGEPSFYKVKTRSACRVAVMSKQHFYEIMELKPDVIVPVARSILKRLSPFLRGIDFALDWEVVDNGREVYRQGDVADSLHVVLSGRLRSVLKQESKTTKDAVGEFGKGDLVGMVEVVMKKPRTTTVLAVRYSTLAKVPEGLLNYIKLKYPQVGFRMMRLLSHYYSMHQRRVAAPILGPAEQHDQMSHFRNLHTIAIFPADKDVPLVAFTCEFYHALQEHLTTLRLSSKIVATNLGNEVLEKSADFRLMHWLNAQEDSYPMVLYECDFEFTSWTRRCIRQADAILVVARGGSDPTKMSKQVEEQLNLAEGIRTNKELILLWPEARRPRGTSEWLKSRTWFSGHHHVRAPSHMFKWLHKDDEDDVVGYYEENIYLQPVNLHSDFSRLSRLLTGNAVGLVLGGGGARGAAHIGTIQSMLERGIPIDIIAGCSIGALIAGLYCDEPDANTLKERARPWFMHVMSVWEQLFDLTYWYSAIFTGAAFNRSIQMLFEDREIEDLWIRYMCVTTDLNTSEIRVHRNGPLWAYCRASMSLAGYMPPLCDPVDGHLLLDGGYVNNVPADIVHAYGIRTVFACDVGSADATNLTNYGDTLSGVWVMWRKLNPWSQPVRILSMQEIQQRLAYVSCCKNLEQVKRAGYCYYLRPPIVNFKTLDFGKFDEIHRVGYDYGVDTIDNMLLSDTKLRCLVQPGLRRALVKLNTLMPLSQMDRTVGSSFADLAAAVTTIPDQRDRAPEIGLMDEYEDLPDVVWEGLHEMEDTDDEVENGTNEETSTRRRRRSVEPPTFRFDNDDKSKDNNYYYSNRSP